MDKSIDSTTWYQQRGANGAPLGEQAKQQAGQVMQQTKEAAGRAADQAVQQVKSQIETGKERATGNLQEVAQALHETGASLRDRNLGAVGQYAETGAELVEQVSGYFRDRSVDQIVDDAEGLARRQAGLFLGGAFALGFILSRFFKSTSPNGSRRDEYGNGYGSSYARASGAMLPATPPYSSEASSAPMTPGTSATPTGSETNPYPGATPTSGER